VERRGFCSQLYGLGDGSHGLADGSHLNLAAISENTRPYFCCKTCSDQALFLCVEVVKEGIDVDIIAISCPVIPVLNSCFLSVVHDSSVDGFPRSKDITREIKLFGKWYSCQECGCLSGNKEEKTVRKDSDDCLKRLSL